MRAIINGKIILKDRIVENCALLYYRLLAGRGLPFGEYTLGGAKIIYNDDVAFGKL